MLGLLLVAFCFFVFIGESLGHPPASPMDVVRAMRAIGVAGAVGLALMGVYCVAMLLALRWERLGVVLAAAALAVFFTMLFLGLFHGNAAGGFSARGIFNPFLLAFWVPVLLYGACWRLESSGG